jgi:uncharacterized protein YndB with AHSA1/START domain
MSTTTQTPAVRLIRTIPASPHEVYRAWLDPQLIRQWFSPSDFTVSGTSVDERVGGRHSIHHSRDGEDLGGFESELIELVPDQRIVFSWGFVGPDHVPDPTHASTLTIELRPTADGQTELTLVHERLTAIGEAMPEVSAGVNEGWSQALGKLAALAGEWS